MEILRQSVIRNTGARVLVKEVPPRINWDTKSKTIALKTNPVLDGDSTYEYVVHLGINDIQEIIGTLTNELARVTKK